jgi:hypothetical protein
MQNQKQRSKLWIKAEFDALIKNGTWTLVFKIKEHADGSIIKFKARLLAKQKFGANYNETFSPIIGKITFPQLLR